MNNKLKLQKISIIIPVYNSANYIESLLKKILTIDNYKEVIVVNDCSTDSSLSILKKFAPHIKLIDLKRNMGVSFARNVGVKNATGRFIAFLDPDDDFELDIYKKMLKRIVKDNSDLCLCNFDEVKNNRSYKSKYMLDYGTISREEALKLFLIDKISRSICFGVYKTNLIKKIKFNESIKIGEDILHLLNILLASKRVSFINEPLYHYMQNEGSATHKLTKNVYDYMKVPFLLKRSDFIYLSNNFKNEWGYFNCELLIRAVHVISLNAKKDKKNAKLMLKELKIANNDFKQILNSPYSSFFVKTEFKILKSFGVNFHLFIFPIYKLVKNILRK